MKLPTSVDTVYRGSIATRCPASRNGNQNVDFHIFIEHDNPFDASDDLTFFVLLLFTRWHCRSLRGESHGDP